MSKSFLFIFLILVCGEICFLNEGVLSQDKKNDKDDSTVKQEAKFSVPEKEIDKFTKDELINTYSFIMGVNLAEEGVSSDSFDAYSYIKGVKEFLKNKDTPFDNVKWSKFNDQLKKINENEKDTPVDFNKIEYSKMAGFNDAKKYVTMGLSLNLVIEGFNQKTFDKTIEITYEKKEEINKKFEVIYMENLKIVHKKYLIENAKNKEVKNLPSGLQYKILKEGVGELIKKEDSIKVHYMASTIDGYEFENTVKLGSTFDISPATSLIDGWIEILKLMKKGSKFQVFIPENLAYGSACISENVLPFATLIFEIEIVDIIKNTSIKVNSKTSASLEFSKKEKESVGKFGTVGPVIKQIVKGEKADITEAADVLIFWDGNSKFNNTLFKHNNRWYGVGGFAGGAMEFFQNEIRIRGGLVIYISDSEKPFGETKYGATISGGIEALSKIPCKFSFAYYPSSKFGEKPEFRHYYDEDNKKIIYKDY